MIHRTGRRIGHILTGTSVAKGGVFRVLSIVVASAVAVVGLPTAAKAAPALAAAPRAVQAAAPSTVFTPPADAHAAMVPASNPPATAWSPQADTRLTPPKGTANRAPAGTTAGAPGIGSLPYFSLYKTELSTDIVAQVNLGHGNLLITGNDGVLSAVEGAERSSRRASVTASEELYAMGHFSLTKSRLA